MGLGQSTETDKACCGCSAGVSVSTRTWQYPDVAAPTDAQLTVPYDTIVRLDHLVIEPGATQPTAPATVYLWSQSAMVSLFKRPVEHDTQSWLVTNATGQQVTLSLKDPADSVVLPANSLSRVYFRVINPSEVVGTAQVELILVAIAP